MTGIPPNLVPSSCSTAAAAPPTPAAVFYCSAGWGRSRRLACGVGPSAALPSLRRSLRLRLGSSPCGWTHGAAPASVRIAHRARQEPSSSGRGFLASDPASPSHRARTIAFSSTLGQIGVLPCLRPRLEPSARSAAPTRLAVPSSQNHCLFFDPGSVRGRSAGARWVEHRAPPERATEAYVVGTPQGTNEEVSRWAACSSSVRGRQVGRAPSAPAATSEDVRCWVLRARSEDVSRRASHLGGADRGWRRAGGSEARKADDE